MNYRSLFLKSASIALFMLNISTPISLLGFFFYCLFQQSSLDSFSIGKVTTQTHKARDITNIHKITKGNYSTHNIRKSIIQEIKEDHPLNVQHPSFKGYDINPLLFKIQAEYYHLFLGLKGIEVKKEAIEDIYDAILHIEMFPDEPIETSQDIAQKVHAIYKTYCRGTPPLTAISEGKIEKVENILNFGYHRHFRIYLDRYPQREELNFILHVGNQYRLKMQLQTTSMLLLVISAYLLYVLPLSLPIIATIMALTATCVFFLQRKSETGHVNLNVGHDPRSNGSALFTRSLRNRNIIYMAGTITLNILVNVLVFFALSLLGGPNILMLLPRELLIGLGAFTAYDRFLYAVVRTPFLTKPKPHPINAERTSRFSNKKEVTPIYSKTEMPAFPIYQPVSAGIRLLHNAAISAVS